MKGFCSLLICAIALPAGVIEGVALEWASGKPLSRTIVNLTPVPGSGLQLKPQQTRTGRSGQFQFPRVPDGLYILQTQRDGFLPAAYGQRRPTGHGTPIGISRDTAIFADLRLHRMGAITGTVLDENSVGIPRVNVVAYRARLPLRIAGHGTSDDRGVFRIAGLELGKYWVRTTAHRIDDGTGLLPMFSPESREPRDALLHEVRFDADTTDANIRPEPGTLSTLSGAIACDRGAGVAVSLTLSSETMRRTAEAGCGGNYQFTTLAPAVYELFATYTDGSGSGFAEISIGQNLQLPVQVVTTQPTSIEIRSAATRSALQSNVQVTARRDDLSGPEPPREVPLRRAFLPAGHWEFSAAVGPGQYVASISGSGREVRRPWRAIRPAEWFPVYLEPWQGGQPIRISVSERAAQLTGVVNSDGKPAPGIPVFLWPVSEETRRMLGGPRELLSDKDGKYSFAGLPPGDYRVLATMDAREASAELMNESRAAAITLIEGQSAQLELTLWLAP